ncbi:MAG: protein-glutamate O-methyltransferase CheR [Phycisphaeraceae bacterium]|nr:protein-glutamate O-methyltransferase CheR [Phycisphaeraceae bacterium]
MSTATTGVIKMSSSQFDRLRKIVYERSGISFEPAKQYVLESRLGRRLNELNMASYDDYITFLTIGPYRDDEFQEMFNRITINETSFFRNEPQLQVFENVALPAMIEARRPMKRLRLWSAACSTGEEPFTLAMLVDRTLGIRLPDWHVEILGTDISERALDIANEAAYTDYAIRTTHKRDLDKYFTQDGKHYHLKDNIKEMVTFERHNLRDTLAAKRHGLWDVIFCRNVMIYFDDEMKQRVVDMFWNQLAPDGWLFIGHSESIRGMKTPFEPQDIPQGFCYRKGS